ncbi:hypothetical protein [Neobacillus sp. YIM B06451]|uniref:hypothetical protein n=1 Tax=Neobacillus sp. YIM B06451 TaxID=3070994 RepID=UPI00292D5208|nr:hypothetical protein [Neobacillus sp. YIM B06451]
MTSTYGFLKKAAIGKAVISKEKHFVPYIVFNVLPFERKEARGACVVYVSTILKLSVDKSTVLIDLLSQR